MYGQKDTYKIVYYPKVLNNGAMGVALIEAYDRSHAMSIFQDEYAGQFHTVYSCERLLG
jgi:hypothetical protein